MIFTEITQATYDFLGTSASDPAFPAGRIQRYINIWLDGFYADIPADVFSLTAILQADPGLDRQYSLTQQSPAITTFRKALEVRLDSDSGAQLSEKTLSELMSVGGRYYAITGNDDEAVVTLGPAMSARTPVFFRYSTWSARLTAAGDKPALPEKFHYLAALGAAELAFAQGGESRFPDSYARMLEDGRSQLYSHMGRRSLDVTTRRAVDGRRR